MSPCIRLEADDIHRHAIQILVIFGVLRLLDRIAAAVIPFAAFIALPGRAHDLVGAVNFSAALTANNKQKDHPAYLLLV